MTLMKQKEHDFQFRGEDLLGWAIDNERYQESRFEYCNRIQRECRIIRYPASNELLLDIDSEEALDLFRKRISRLVTEIGIRCPVGDMNNYEIYPSITEGHYHIIVKMPFDLGPYERICWQFALCSDPVRETLSILRILDGDEYPTLLAMKEEKE